MGILVTGASGQLGRAVCAALSKQNIPHLGTDSQSLNLLDSDAVSWAVADYRPEAVVHCAAYTDVDGAEGDPAAAFALNEGGTAALAAACSHVGAKLLYVSTDYVFPGGGDRPWRTDDPTGPLNVYGRSKLAGERAVQSALERCFIVRVSWLFSADGRNFVKTMLRLADSHSRLRVVADQLGAPTYAADLAPLLCEMLQTEAYGVYHAAGAGTCSWAAFAEEIFRQAGRAVAVEPVTTAEYGARAPRPKNSRLCMDALDAAGFSRLPPWQDGLRRCLLALNAPAKEEAAHGTA